MDRYERAASSDRLFRLFPVTEVLITVKGMKARRIDVS